MKSFLGYSALLGIDKILEIGPKLLILLRKYCTHKAKFPQNRVLKTEINNLLLPLKCKIMENKSYLPIAEVILNPMVPKNAAKK